jgi:hypothetical protein
MIMKQLLIAAYSLSIFQLAFLSSCKEVGPDINLGGSANAVSDTTYVESPVATRELKNIVIEEFTGVKCPNCPQGHVIIANIKAANPNRVVAVSLHPINGFGAQYSFSTQNFTSQAATDLMIDYFTWPGFEPIAAIDRKLFSAENTILVDKAKWVNYSAQQLTELVPVNLLLSKTYDTSSRELTIVVELHYIDSITEANKLTVLLTESDIVTAQLDGSTVDTFYTHKDIMRDFVTNMTGDVITQSLGAGRVVRKVYKKILDVVWKPENMHVAAYIHEYATSKRIYQAKEIEVQ